MTLYETLGVAPDATEAEIKKAYRSKAQQLHPDREGGDKEAFQKVQKAYEVLSDAERRAKYDATGETGDGPSIEDQIKAAAMQGLAKLLIKCVQECSSVEHFDILESVRKKVGTIQREIDAEAKSTHRVKGKHERAIKRTKAKQGENIAAMLMQGAVDALQQKLHELEMHSKVADKMLGILNNHEYEVDEVGGADTRQNIDASTLDELVRQVFGRSTT